MVTSKIKLLGSIFLAGLTLSACSQAPENLADLEPARTAKEKHLNQLEQWIFPATEAEQARAAFNDRCVAQRGGSYVPKTGQVTFESVLGIGFSAEDAKSHGYTPEDKLAPTVAIDEKSAQAFFGDPQKGVIEATLLEYSSGEIPIDGCMAEGLQYVYGSVENGLKAAVIAPSFIQAVRHELLENSEYIDIQTSWSACMADAGYEGFENTQAAEQSADPIRPEETKDLAIADATCRESVDFDSKVQAIADRYLEAIYLRVKNVDGELEKIRQTSLENVEADKADPKSSSPVTVEPSPSDSTTAS